MAGPYSGAVISCTLKFERDSATAIKVHHGRVQALQNKKAVDSQQLRGQQDPQSSHCSDLEGKSECRIRSTNQ